MKLKARNWTKIFEKYPGQWVALTDQGRRVVSSGESLKTAIRQAKKLGFENPSIFKVPTEPILYVGQA